MKEAEKMLSDYAKYISSLSKIELIKLIIGTDNKPPLLTRNEPKYSRPQILWGLVKALETYPVKVVFDDLENLTDEIMNKIECMKWENFYNYDYIRFDIRKPSLYWVLIIFLLSLIGFVYTVWQISKFIIDLF